MAIVLYDKAQNRRLFEITVAQRDQLVDALEEESLTDHDYYIDAAVIDFLDGKIDAELLSKLRPLVGAPAVAPTDGVEMAGDDEMPPEMPLGSVETEGLDIEWREE